MATVAEKAEKLALTPELLAFIEQEQLFDSGCGAVDIHLLASARLLPGVRLWTLDKPLHALARRLGVAWVVPTR